MLKSVIDEEHGIEWMKEHGIYTYPRKIDEVYIWANDAPGKVPLYWDFMLEAKEKVEAKVAELDIPWETDDYQPLPDWKPGCGLMLRTRITTSSPSITPMRSIPIRGLWKTPGSMRSMKRIPMATPSK